MEARRVKSENETVISSDQLNTVLWDDLLAEILSKLNSLVDRQNASLVCRRWLKTQRTTETVLGLRIPTHDDETDSSTWLGNYSRLPHLIAQHPYLTKLVVESSGPKGRRLNITPSEEQASKIVQTLVSMSCSSTKSLKHLVFTAGRLSASDLHQLSNGCPNISSLEILHPASANCLPILCKFQSLQDLCLVGVDIPAASAFKLGTRNNNDTSDEYAAAANSILPVVNLRLENINDEGAGNCDLEWLWRSCHRLQTLELVECDGLAGVTTHVVDDYNNIGKTISMLKELKLQRCRRIAGKVLELVAKFSPHLKSLTVHDGADTQSLLQIIRKCKRLEILDLRLPMDLKSHDLIQFLEIIRSHEFMKSLRLRSCCIPSRADYECYMLQQQQQLYNANYNYTPCSSSKLEELVLVDCWAKSNYGYKDSTAATADLSLQALIGQMMMTSNKKNPLKRIDLSGNESLSDFELAAILLQQASSPSSSCELDVQNLRISNCNGLTDKIMEFIGQRCMKLGSIDIRGCNGISQEGVSALHTRCTRHGNLKQVLVEAHKLVVTESRN